jgi:hypothetical protein
MPKNQAPASLVANGELGSAAPSTITAIATKPPMADPHGVPRA